MSQLFKKKNGAKASANALLASSHRSAGADQELVNEDILALTTVRLTE